jgi:hypothetical protein
MIRLTVAGGPSHGRRRLRRVHPASGQAYDAMGVRDVSRYPLATSLNRRKVSM